MKNENNEENEIIVKEERIKQLEIELQKLEENLNEEIIIKNEIIKEKKQIETKIININENTINQENNYLKLQINNYKEMEKEYNELKIMNEELKCKNNLLNKQIINEKLLIIKDCQEENNNNNNMSAADYLLNRFANEDMLDYRLNNEERMKKIGKDLDLLSNDINDLMSKWLNNKNVNENRYQGSSLFYQIRHLIGHFNLAINEIKELKEKLEKKRKKKIKK